MISALFCIVAGARWRNAPNVVSMASCGLSLTSHATSDHPLRIHPCMTDSLARRVALGGDHAGFTLKTALAARFAGRLTTLIDCGTDGEESCDYPDFAVAVARQILAGHADRGILVCGSGVGVSVAANKITGIRAAICHDTYSARQGVEHDDMNVLCIGGRIIGSELAFEIVEAFLRASYVPEARHARRLEKVLAIEKHGIDAQR